MLWQSLPYPAKIRLMSTYNISLNPALAQIVEREIKVKKYASRSEFFRDLLRHYFLEPEIEKLNPGEADYAFLQKRARNFKQGKSIQQVLNDLQD